MKPASSILGVLALLVSSVSSAATVVVTCGTGTTPAGSGQCDAPLANFSIVLRAVDFVNVGGGTWSVTWNTSIATLVSAALPSSGPVGTGTGTFLVNNNPTFDLLPGAPPISGDFDFAVFTFNKIAGGSMNLQVFENQADVNGWFDNDTAEQIPTTYTQATIGYLPCEPNCPPPVPAPTAIWLLGTAVAALGGRQWLRRKATAQL